jgi:hypothetical protein
MGTRTQRLALVARGSASRTYLKDFLSFGSCTIIFSCQDILLIAVESAPVKVWRDGPHASDLVHP